MPDTNAAQQVVPVNEVADRLRMFGGAYKEANPFGGPADWPDDGKHVVVVKGMTIKPGNIRMGDMQFNGMVARFQYQLVDDPERETPRSWSGAPFKFPSDDDFRRLPENHQGGIRADQDRFSGFAQQITGNATKDLPTDASAILNEINSGRTLLMRINVTSRPNKTNPNRPWKTDYAVERLPE